MASGAEQDEYKAKRSLYFSVLWESTTAGSCNCVIEGIRGNIYLMGQQKGELKKYRFVARRAKPNQMNWIA